MSLTENPKTGRLIKRLYLPIALLLLATVGYAVAKRQGAAKKDAITYEFGKVERGDVRSSVTASGVIQPWKTVDIKADVAGRIDSLPVDLGTRVKAGQLIMTIDPTDTQTAFDQAKADLDAAEARKTQAQVSVVQEKAQSRARVASAERAVESARARLAEARTNMLVQPKLTRSSINQAAAALSSAGKAMTQTQNNKKQLQDQLTQLQEVTIPLNRETVEANVSEARANLEVAQAEHHRQTELLTKGYVSKSAVDAAYAKLASAQSSVRTAEQRRATLDKENQLAVQQLQSQIDEAQGRIEENQARVDQADAALRLARDGRYQDDVRRQEYDAAKAALAQAEADLDSAKAQLNQVAVKEKDVLAAATQEVRGRSALTQAKTNLSYTRIMSPRDGVVLAKNVEVGTVVPSGRGSIGSTNALLQIGDTSRLWVVCLVDETDIAQIRVGQNVIVKVDAYSNTPVDGKVIRIDPQAQLQQNVTMIPVTVELAKPDDRFKPTMNAECEFIVAQAKNVLTVPNEALHDNEGVQTVQKLVDNKPKDYKVEVGVAGQDVTEIRSGLREGEQVITKINIPEEAQVNNPFGGPFGRRPGGRGGPGGGGRGGQGGGSRGGGRSGGGR